MAARWCWRAVAANTLYDQRRGAAPAAERRHDRLMLILRALGPFAAGYFTSYLFRVVNAAISDDLVTELGLSNTDLGLMTSMYLYGFVLFQLPLGLLLDRFGPRLVQTGLLLVAALGPASSRSAPIPQALPARGC